MDKINVSLKNDLFFKYSFGLDDEQSKRLLIKTLSYLTELDIVDVKIVNPNIIPDEFTGKEIILDVLAVDNNGNHYNIEMQNSKYNIALHLRFQYYLGRMMAKCLPKAGYYYEIPNVYQIVFIDDVHEDGLLVEKAILKNQLDKEIKENRFHQIKVHIPLIDEVVKEKGIDNLNEFEQLVYLFKYGENDDIIRLRNQGSEVLQIMGEKLNSFYCNPELWTMAAKMKQAEEEHEGERAFYESEIAKAKKAAKEAAKESANLEKINSCTKIIKNIYHQECHEWLVTLTNNQLDQLQDLAFQINDFDELKQAIESIEQ